MARNQIDTSAGYDGIQIVSILAKRRWLAMASTGADKDPKGEYPGGETTIVRIRVQDDGWNLFASHALFGTPLPKLCRGVLPFLAIYLAMLLLITYVPAITLAPLRLWR